MSLSPEQIRLHLASQAMRIRALEIAVQKLQPTFEPHGASVPSIQEAAAPSPVVVVPAQASEAEVAADTMAFPPLREAPAAIPADGAPAFPVPTEKHTDDVLKSLLKVKEHLDLQPPTVAEPPEVVVPGEIEFLTQGEMDATATPSAVPPPSSTKSDGKSLEENFGTQWLLRIGGVLLLIGAAFLASYVNKNFLGPLGRVASSHALAMVLGLTGIWLAKRNQLGGRTLQVIALSLGYFVSFGAGFINGMKLFNESFVIPALLMVGFGTAIVFVAERWRTERLAMFGFLLAIIAVLVGAKEGVDSIYALGAIGVISLSAAALLLRNQWVQLTSLVVVAVYATLPGLWVLAGIEKGMAGFLPNFVALLSYHVIFAAAFWRWSRVWIARENLYEQERAKGTLPSTTPLAESPYSHAFAIINSLALVTLSTALLLLTDASWKDHAWYLYFPLAALEMLRFAIPAFRRTRLMLFHTILASLLVTMGVMSAMKGLEQSAILAAQTLLLAVAAGRTKRLRGLAISSFVPAFLSLVSFSNRLFATTIDVAAALLTPVMIFVAVLPWRRFMGTEVEKPSLLFIIPERFVRFCQTMIATLLFGFIAQQYMGRGNEFTLGWVFFVAANLFLYGSLFLRTRMWQIPAAIYTIASLALLVADNVNPLTEVIGLAVQLFFHSIAWDAIGRRDQKLKTFYGFFWAILAATSLLVCFALTTIQSDANLHFEGMLSFVYMGMALVAAGAFGLSRGKLSIAHLVDRNEAAPPTRISLSLFIAVPFALVAVFTSFIDAYHNPMASILLAAIAFTVWHVQVKKGAPETLSALWAAAGMLCITAGLLIYSRFGQPTILGLGAFGIAFMLLSARLRASSAGMLAALHTIVMGVIAIGAYTMVSHNQPNLFVQSLCALLTALLILLTTPLFARTSRLLGWAGQYRDVSRFLSSIRTTVGIVLAIFVLSGEMVFPNDFEGIAWVPLQYITVSWGLLASTLLVGGFIFRNATMRYGALALFGLSVGRVALYELSGTETLTKIIAFIGLGILLIAAGVAYGVLSKRFLHEQKPEPDGKEAEGSREA